MPAEEVKNVVIGETDPNTSLEDKDVELFGGEEETQIVEKVKEEPKEEVKEEVKEEEEEVKEEEVKEEVEELIPVEGYPTPTFGAINTKYPNFFKDFPEMREVMGRHNAFTELFPEGIKEAEQAKENDKDFTFFSEKVESGDAKSFLEVIKDTGKADLTQFVGNFLPALKELDNNLYVETTAPLFVDVLQSTYFDADRAGNENLKNSVLHVSKYLFNDHRFATGEVKFKPKEKIEEKVSKEKEEIEKERKSLMEERWKTAITEVTDTVGSKLENVVRGEIPDGLNEFVADSLVKTIMKEADDVLGKDPQHQRNVIRLWKLAESDKFSFGSRQRIISAVMKRYQEVIPEIRRKNIARATKGTNVRTETRREVTSGKPNTSSSKRSSGKEVDWKKTSDEDLFSGNITYK